MAKLSAQQRIGLTILVAALGYFVDVFDLQLFTMVRVSSLKSLGLGPDEVASAGSMLLNCQMAGMLLGGLFWGMWGDKKGRVSVLFGTILLYSFGNIANAFVTSVPAYAVARFFTGFGLAGEIGAGITLASELLPKGTRSYGNMIIVSCGVAGPFVAGYAADAFDWHTVYLIGGGLGFALFALRVSVNESGLFGAIKAQPHVRRGRLRMLFTDHNRLLRYFRCVAIALPVWFTVGSIVIFSPELGKSLGIATPLKASTATVAYYVGSTLGNIVSGLLSQIFANRKKILALFIFANIVVVAAVVLLPGLTAEGFYGLMGLAGICCGAWCLFMSTTAEQFGTNLRATATTTAPNFVRASVIVNAFLISLLKPDLGLPGSIIAVGIAVFAVALLSLWKMPETFGRELDFIER